MDALRCLREATIRKELHTVTIKNDMIHFGDKAAFPRKTQTSYRSQRGTKAFYDLESLLYFIKEGCTVGTGVYMREAQAKQLIAVSFVDRKDVQEYLQGDIETSEFVQITAPTLPEALPLSQAAGAGDAEAKRKRAEDAATLMRLVSYTQRPLKDRRSVLAVPSHDFQKVLDVLTTKTSRKGDDGRPTSSFGRGKDDAKAAPPNAYPPSAGRSSARPSSSSKPSKAAAAAAPNTPVHGAAHKGAAPIILVPSGYGATVVVNMLNAKKFFGESAFEPWEKLQEAGVRKEEKLMVRRTYGRPTPVAYKLMDKPPPKDSKDWGRVVAVVVTGAKWQFKDWPFKGAADGDLVDTFAHVKGFHLKYSDTPLQPQIKDWPVSIINIPRISRHNDAGLLESVWQEIDIFLNSRRSALKY